MTEQVSADILMEVCTGVLQSVGFSVPGAKTIATSLVESDARGVHSHGVMLLPLYVSRTRAGLVATHDAGDVVTESSTIGVIDGRHGAGQILGKQAMALAVDKARAVGIGAVAVRHSNHFGAGAAYVEYAAASGCIGIAMSNTTPLMPAPGGAEPVVGNNPVAIGIPRATERPIVLDMALSAVAGGKIRYFASADRAIPDNWAVDQDGQPTTDPHEALAGLLLPFGGHKGFGLALIVDLLTGGLSGGATGRGVRSIYREMEHPNDCSHFFMALDVGAFVDPGQFSSVVDDVAAGVHGSRLAPGTERTFLPGEIEADQAAETFSHGIELESSVLDALRELAVECHVGWPER